MSNPRRIISVSILGSVVVGCLVSAAAQTKSGATRIRFKRGKSSATIKGQLTSRHLEKAFLVGAQAGQDLYLEVKARTSDGLDFALLQVYDPSGQPLGTGQEDSRIQLKQTGD